jgi:transcriptional regulator with XRE-family HTH domain
MEWGASRILALRKHAGMTQAQFARWLGVSIKQVKYLEHQRRNPSGPTQRLLDILAYQLSVGGASAIQVLGSGLAELKASAATVEPPQPLPTERDGRGNGAAVAETPSDPQAVQREAATPLSAPEDEAFVWS